jgi:hypothetical protein
MLFRPNVTDPRFEAIDTEKAAKILGWAGNAFLLAGAFLVGEKSPTAFLLVFAGEAIWTIKVARMKQWDMLFICVVFGLLALRNYWLWTQ